MTEPERIYRERKGISMGWWETNRLRMVQFNLQQEDAAIDTSRLVEQLKSYHANAVMIGAGGIVSYYPTNLPYHYRSPYLGGGDMLGSLVEKCHRNGIRVIARFDFSKVHESIALKHPEWLYRDKKGDIVNYHGMVHACLSGEYVWDHSLDILRECLGAYPVDGIYLNMFGYQTFDYDGVDHGLCHCENCRRMIREATGLETMPEHGDKEGMRKVREWQSKRIEIMLHRLRETVKGINPEISICSHTELPLVDMTHTESNTALNRRLPLWLYPSFDNIRLTNDQGRKIYSANCCINAIDIAWRFMGVSPYFNSMRLWQGLAAGGQLEWCMVGTPDRYPETANDESVRTVFGFHEENERFFGCRRSLAQIALVRANNAFPPDDGTMDEYRGLLSMLKEAHYQFDVITEDNVARLGGKYRLLIMPDSRVRADDIPSGCCVLSTGATFREDEKTLFQRFGARYLRTEKKVDGAYLLCDDHQLFKRIPKRSWIALAEEIDLMECEEGSLPYMAAGVFGPVEIAGGVYPSPYRAAIMKRSDARANILLPWFPGRMYFRYGLMEYRDIVLDLIDSLLGEQPVRIDAPDMVDAYYDGCPGGRMIQLVNLTGCCGTTVHAPVTIHDITVELPAEGSSYAMDLRTKKALPVQMNAGRMTIQLPPLDDYACVLIPDGVAERVE